MAGLRLCRAQGLRHGATSDGAGGARAVSDSPEKFRAAKTAGTQTILATDFHRRNTDKNFRRIQSPKNQCPSVLICGPRMNLLEKLKTRLKGKSKPEHLRRGELGE